MMEEQLRLNYMRREYSTQGWALLIYTLIMNIAVTLVMGFDAIYQMLAAIGEGQAVDTEYLVNSLYDNSGWGYFLAIGVGLLILLLWKKSDFCRKKLWKKGKPMTAGSFFAILSIFVSGQLIFLIGTIAAEIILNGFGMSLEGLMESTDISTDSLSMFLYAGLGAPISEEILFRGLVLRSTEPFGKKFAIFSSALLFGLFHGNLIQAPYAFVVGLVLGYVTVEYSIIWAMVLHMFNNLILSDTLTRLTSDWPYPLGDTFTWAVIIAFSIAALGVGIAKRKAIANYFRQEHDDPLCAKAFWSAPGIIVLMIVLVGTILLSTFLTMFAL